MLAASEHYLTPSRSLATVPAVAEWYGTDPGAYVYDEYAGTYRVTDRRTYRALSVLLAIAPIGGRTFLGMARRTVAAAALTAVLAGAAISAAIPAPCYGDDGYRCVSEAEYADVLARLDVIRSERSGGRFDVLAACAITNGAELTEDACADYLRKNARLTAACGHLREQSAYEDCEAATLAEGS
jgi:hypothetical protein